MRNESRSFLRLILALAAFAGFEARAALSPVGLSIFAPIQFPGRESDVTGARFNLLWGSHRRVYGVDLSAVGGSTMHFGGLLQAAGLVNFNRSTVTVVGLQLAGGGNVNTNATRLFGIQAAAYNHNAGETLLVGLGLGLLANNAPHATIVGVQAAALYNSARTVNGVQIGLYNVAEKLRGLQIGLINVNRTGLFKVCPIINFGF